MSDTFLYADPHFSSTGSCKWLYQDGSKIRPWDNFQDMDKALIWNWNKVVGPQDKVYVLGDVSMKKAGVALMEILNGRKVLIKGNHDLEKPSFYSKYFYDVRACHQLDKYILTHIPIHPDSLSRWTYNIHGHTHQNKVLLPGGEIDPRYFCVSVEQINYTPIPFETVKKIMKERSQICSG